MSVEVEIFSSPGCTKCSHAREVLRRLTEEVEHGRIEWREVNVLNELDYAVSLGVLSTPAIAINGGLVFYRVAFRKQVAQRTQPAAPCQ